MVPLTISGQKTTLDLPKALAPLIAAMDGRRALGEIAKQTRQDPISFGANWAKLDTALRPWGLIHYSALNAP